MQYAFDPQGATPAHIPVARNPRGHSRNAASPTRPAKRRCEFRLIATTIVCDSPAPAQPNRLELGAFIAHVIRADHATAIRFPERMDQGPGYCGGFDWATAIEAKHEALMTIHPLPIRPLRTKVLATVLTTLMLASTASTAFARTIYDGAWSVLIITQSGSCDPTYRYGVLINDGVVVYDGTAPITLQGRVTPKGVVRVILQAGSQWADGSGRLTRNRGAGVWKGQGTTTLCAGVWQAERRPPG